MRADVRGVGRYRSGIEATVYFCAVQMLRTCSVHTGSTPLAVSVTDDGHELLVTVTGTAAGSGGSSPAQEELDAITDRLAVLGGRADAVSGEDARLTLRATVPVNADDRCDTA